MSLMYFSVIYTGFDALASMKAKNKEEGARQFRCPTLPETIFVEEGKPAMLIDMNGIELLAYLPGIIFQPRNVSTSSHTSVKFCS